ncbi:hypothetical protein [Paracoccus litorisediminis]|uniref:Uncharacterized protein n=1 Tax=Paracoccus litorisediminis TaxID=2006130 RepID=A0A844HSU5_9RHOB|nr:hypothetical protein [Paracoccus litorisediminis]MTH60671.1 hypothetical protein [Paracoccus litorisediminis]
MFTGLNVNGIFIYLAGLLTGYLAVRYRLTISDRASQVSDHIKDMEKLHEAAVAFWSSPSDPEKGDDKKIRVLSGLTVFMRIYPAISRMASQKSPHYESLVSEYFRACTGGNFDDPKRQADLPKAVELSNVHAQLVDLLRQIRCDLSSVSMLIEDSINLAKGTWESFNSTFLKP